MRSMSKRVNFSFSIVIILTMIASACAPGNKSTTAAETTPQANGQIPANDYEAPLYTHPDPIVADDSGDSAVDLTTTQAILASSQAIIDNANTLIQKKEAEIESNSVLIQEQYESAIEARIDYEESITPLPNPERVINENPQANNASGKNALTINTKRPLIQDGTITVTTLADTDDGVCDADCSLREAIYLANESTEPVTIVFDVSGTIFLLKPLPYILGSDKLTIDGEGQEIQINAGQAGQSFFVGADASLEIRGLSFSKGLFYNAGTLNIVNSSFENSNNNSLSSNPAQGYVNSVAYHKQGEETCDLYSEGSLTVSGTFENCGVVALGNVSVSGGTFINGWAYAHGTISISGSHFTTAL